MTEDDFPRGDGDPDFYSAPPKGDSRWVGAKPPQVEIHYWWEDLSPREAYAVQHLLPEEIVDQIDYDPRIDEDREDINDLD